MPEHLKMLAAMTAMAALSTTAVLWLVNEAAQEASKGTVGLGLALLLRTACPGCSSWLPFPNLLPTFIFNFILEFGN